MKLPQFVARRTRMRRAAPVPDIPRTAIFDAMPAHLAILDDAGVIVEVNSAWRRFAGANGLRDPAGAACVGTSYLGTCDRAAGIGPVVSTGIRAVLAGRQPDFTQIYACHAPTEKRWFTLYVTPLQLGEKSGAMAAHWNVTDVFEGDRIRSELVAIVESSSDAIIGSDLDGIVTSWNEGAENIFGISTASIIGQPIERIIPDDRRMEQQEILARVRVGGIVPAFETVRLRQGTPFHVSVTVSPIRDADGVVVGAARILRDVSAERLAQDALAEVSRSLAEVVSALGELATTSGSSADLMELAVARCMAICAADGAVISTIEGDAVVGRAGAGVGQRARGMRHTLAGSLSGVVVASGQAHLCTDTESDPSVDPHARTLGTRSMVIAALRTRSGVIGTVAVLSARPGAFTQRDVANIEILAAAVGSLLERRELDEQMRVSEAEYRLLFRDNPQPMWIYDESTQRFLAVNAAATAHYGWSEPEFLSMTLGDIRPIEDLPFLKEIGRQGRTPRMSFDGVHHVTRDGTVISVDLRSDAIVFGGARARLVVAQDVTARLTALREVARINRALRLMGSCHEALIHATDAESLLTRVCEAAVEIGGYRMAWVGAAINDEQKSIRPISHAGYEDDYLSGLQLTWSDETPWGREPGGRAVRSGAPVICDDIRLELADSPWSEAAAQRGFRGVVCLPLINGERTFAILCLYSGEVQRMSDDEVVLLTNLSNELAFGVTSLEVQRERQRLESVQREQETMLLRAQRMESLGTLAGGIAHDLNNALAPILLSVDLLREDVPPGSIDLLDTVAWSAQRAADMATQVLSFAQGVDGQRVDVQLRHLVRDLERIIRGGFPKNIDFQVDAADNLRPVLGDPTQLQQVLLSLCTNGRDAMPDGGVLRLSAVNIDVDTGYAAMHSEAAVGPYVMVTVEDTGTGMHPDIVARMFDPFFTTKEPGRGVGLGLSTALAIVRSHDGFLRVYSEPGSGTKVEVYLRAATKPAEDSAPAAAVDAPRGTGQLILVIDDEASIRDITRQTLEAHGYRVVVAADGAEAVAIYAQRQSEIAGVITDMMMPVMDGAATIRVLLRINPAVRIVAVSGVLAGPRGAMGAVAGATRQLAKPYAARTLLTVLADVLLEA